MKRISIISLLSILPNVIFAQRYGIGSDEGARGLKIFGIIILVVIGIVAWLYIRQRLIKKR